MTIQNIFCQARECACLIVMMNLLSKKVLKYWMIITEEGSNNTCIPTLTKLIYKYDFNHICLSIFNVSCCSDPFYISYVAEKESLMLECHYLRLYS